MSRLICAAERLTLLGLLRVKSLNMAQVEPRHVATECLLKSRSPHLRWCTVFPDQFLSESAWFGQSDPADIADPSTLFA